ncbi:MAG TPA: CBS domain-containing protein, partial [Candidatus Limnocylindrales bacterium]|nr:CBS domain-containing protein [Candidatus Limnocylindrales bacterium]
FFPGTYDATVVDRWVRVSDREAFRRARRITREEGILAGESCGTAVIAALAEAARVMASDPAAARRAMMVVILPDGGRNYLSKLYNDEWMRVNGMLDSPGSVVRVGDLLGRDHRDAELPAVVVARTTERVGDAIEHLQEFGISQMPVSERPTGDELVGIVGSVSEKSLLDRAYRDPGVVDRTVGEVMDRPLPTIGVDATLDDAFAVLSGPASALLAVRRDRAAGVVTKLDLLEFLSHRAS